MPTGDRQDTFGGANKVSRRLAYGEPGPDPGDRNTHLVATPVQQFQPARSIVRVPSLHQPAGEERALRSESTWVNLVELLPSYFGKITQTPTSQLLHL